MTRVVILDEKKSVAERVQQCLGEAKQAGLEIAMLNEGEFTKVVKDLGEATKRLVAEKKTPALVKDERGLLAHDSIILVDEDMEEWQDLAALPRGEKLAQALRIFAEVGPIVVVNPRPPHVPTFYLGHPPPSLDADWKLRQQDLLAPSIWGRQAEDTFDPWYSPNLVHLAATHKARSKTIETKWDENLLSGVFGFGKDVLPFVPSELRPAGDLDLAEYSPQKLAEQFAPNAVASDKTRAAPLVSSILSNWVYTTLLSPQTPLVDAPHLATRFPSLFDHKDLGTLRVKSDGAFKLARGISNYEYHSDWIDRATWLMRAVGADESIKEVKSPWERKTLDEKFAEDASTFTTRKVHEYTAVGAFSTRFVRYFKDAARYEPIRRLLQE